MMNTILKKYIDSLDINLIPENRKLILGELKKYVEDKRNAGEQIALIFICTHNSRRSQLGQIWAQTIGIYFGFSLNTYSGGVEVTAFNETAVETLKNSGFEILKAGNSNPVYELKFASDKKSITAFSKVYDDAVNPKKDFAAVMTCSHADENCPIIFGADTRISINYEDPKKADNTPSEKAVYEERCKQIATEMKYVFNC